jgi:GH24 family phage-related lysozyme (muramidase)
MGLPVDDGPQPQRAQQRRPVQSHQNRSATKPGRQKARSRDGLSSSNELVQRFKQHMIPKENDRNDVYLDSRGVPTVGIGHKVTPRDKLELGDRISDVQKEEFWRRDSAKALARGLQQMREAGITDPNFVLPLADVNFQLGPSWRGEFRKTWALMVAGNYQAAAREVKNSKWFRQTPDRVLVFQQALVRLPPKQVLKKKKAP